MSSSVANQAGYQNSKSSIQSDIVAILRYEQEAVGFKGQRVLEHQ